MKVKCPHCGHINKAPDEYAGRKVQCPKCKKSLVAKPVTEEGVRDQEQVGQQCYAMGKGNRMSKWERIPVYSSLVILGFLCVWGLKPQTEFERVTIVNDHGDRAVELSATPRGTGLIVIFNREDNSAVSLSEAGMKCYGDEGKERVWIGRRNTDKRPGSIVLSDASGIGQVVLSGSANGGRVSTYTPAGKMLTFMGGFSVRGGDPYERPLAGSVQSYDFKGGPLAAFGTNSKGGGSLTLWGGDGQVIFDVPPTLKGRSEDGGGLRSRVD